MDWLTDAKFANAREKDLPWTEIAGRFSEGLVRAAAQGEAARTRYQKDAARHTGYSIGMLRNMAATLDWVEQGPARHVISRDVLLKSLTALDLIRRLDVHNPKTAGDYLSRLCTATGVRVSSLRAELKEIARKYDEARRPPETESTQTFKEIEVPMVAETPVLARQARPSLAQVRSWRINEAMDGIYKLLPAVSGNVHRFGRPEGVSPIGIRATAIAWLDEGMTVGDAFEVVNAGHGLSRSTLSDHVSRAIASSRYFRRHYLAFTADSEPDAVYKTKESLESLRIPAIGVLWFGHRGSDAILLKADGTPEPDYRDKLGDICKHGHWR